ncbi:NAD-dependent aldehyde dehydrogenases [Candidatus Brocadia sinica JPN1]|uniref:NAD-dependent aldehyde dehydrogenases n=1 Tax=Candidatus Brocadia sinica JPN1 TaxID=1197129 RepID=A0ABQ0JYJ7_9BACT|nr:NAD-dependent aldehyde dehydrogenases [Candidatus Brocadia sinica JPN1]
MFCDVAVMLTPVLIELTSDKEWITYEFGVPPPRWQILFLAVRITDKERNI